MLVFGLSRAGLDDEPVAIRDRGFGAAAIGAASQDGPSVSLRLNCPPFLGHEKWGFLMRTDLRVKHDVETRRHAAELFDSGMGRWAASRALSIPRGTVRQRRRIYRAFGSEVLLTMDGKQARYTYEQSVAAASAVADGGATKAEAVAALRSRRSSRAPPTAAATGRWPCACAPSWARASPTRPCSR